MEREGRVWIVGLDAANNVCMCRKPYFVCFEARFLNSFSACLGPSLTNQDSIYRSPTDCKKNECFQGSISLSFLVASGAKGGSVKAASQDYLHDIIPP